MTSMSAARALPAHKRRGTGRPRRTRTSSPSIGRAGTDIAPEPGTPDGEKRSGDRREGRPDLPRSGPGDAASAPRPGRGSSGRAPGPGILGAEGRRDRFRPHAPARDLGRAGAPLGRGPGRPLLRLGHPLQPRQPRVPREGLPDEHPLRRRAGPPGVLFPDAFLPGRPGSSSWETAPPGSGMSAGAYGCSPCTGRRTRWDTSTPATATTGSRPAAGTSCSSTRASGGRGRLVGQLRRHLVHLLRPREPGDARGRSRGSSLTTAGAPRPRGPGRRNGAAAGTTGGDAT
jgi:hypothetical protein